MNSGWPEKRCRLSAVAEQLIDGAMPRTTTVPSGNVTLHGAPSESIASSTTYCLIDESRQVSPTAPLIGPAQPSITVPVASTSAKSIHCVEIPVLLRAEKM